jgi:hypothetical protein
VSEDREARMLRLHRGEDVHLPYDVNFLLSELRTAEADRDAYKDEAKRLRSWKAEATAVLTGWEAAFLALPREVREAPQNLGRSKARVTHDWIRSALDGDA